MSRWRPWIRIALAGVLVCAACGGGNEDDRSRAAPIASRTATSTISVADLVGVYGLHVEDAEPAFSETSIAVVSLDDDGGLQLCLDFAARAILLSGTLIGDGHLVLEGSGTVGGDVAFDVLGTGIVDTGPDGCRRITGSVGGLALRDETGPTIHFVLERCRFRPGSFD